MAAMARRGTDATDDDTAGERDWAAEYAAGTITLSELNAAAADAGTAATTAADVSDLQPVTTDDLT